MTRDLPLADIGPHRAQPESRADVERFAALQARAVEEVNPHDPAPCACDPCTLARLELA